MLSYIDLPEVELAAVPGTNGCALDRSRILVDDVVELPPPQPAGVMLAGLQIAAGDPACNGVEVDDTNGAALLLSRVRPPAVLDAPDPGVEIAPADSVCPM